MIETPVRMRGGWPRGVGCSSFGERAKQAHSLATSNRHHRRREVAWLQQGLLVAVHADRCPAGRSIASSKQLWHHRTPPSACPDCRRSSAFQRATRTLVARCCSCRCPLMGWHSGLLAGWLRKLEKPILAAALPLMLMIARFATRGLPADTPKLETSGVTAKRMC